MKNGGKRFPCLRVLALLTVLVSVLAVCGLTTAFADEGHDPVFTPWRHPLVNPFKTADADYMAAGGAHLGMYRIDIKPEAAPIRVGQKLRDSELSGGRVCDSADDVILGKFVWHEPDMIPPLGIDYYLVEFIPSSNFGWQGINDVCSVPLEVLP